MKNICDNCGLTFNKICKCSLVPAPQTLEVVAAKPIPPVSSSQVVAISSLDLTSANRGSIVMTPAGKSPFDLTGDSDAEILFWGEKTINWFYDKQRSSRLSLDGLLHYAAQCVENRYTEDGRKRLANIKLILKAFVK